MSSQNITILVCDRCGTELRIQGDDPAYIAGWSSACGWSEIDGRDYCPECVTRWDREAFDDMFADVLAEAAGGTA